MELEKYYDKIEAYREGRLNGPEKEAFEAQLQTDGELNQAWNLYQMSLAALELHKEAGIRQALEKARSENRKSLVLRHRYLAIAASLALLLSASGAWWYARNWYSDEALYQAYYTLPSDMAPSRMGEGEGTVTPLQRGLEAYAAGEEAQALKTLESIAPDQPDYENARFALAQIYLRAGRSEDAIPYISPLTASLEPSLAARSEWYLALALLQSGKTAECREWLEKIAADPAHPYQGKAGELLKSLRSLMKKTCDL